MIVEFVTNIVRKSTVAYHLHQYKTGTEFLINQAVTGYLMKIELAAYVSAPLFTLLLQYGPLETSVNERFCTLMAVSSSYSKH